MRVLSIASTLVATALATRTYSGSSLTLWFVFLALLVIPGVADLGVTSRMTTAVARVRDPTGAGSTEVQQLYGSAARVSALCAMPLFGLGIAITAIVDAGPGSATEDLSYATVVFLAILTISVPLKTPGRLLQGLQRGATEQLCLAGGHALLLVGLLALVLLDTWNFALFTAVTASILVTSGVLAWIVVVRSTPFRMSARTGPRRAVLRDVGRESSAYLAIGVASAVAFSSDNVLLAWLGTDREVAEYATTYRLFTFVPVTILLGAQSLWPASADASATDDREWLSRTTRQVLTLSFIVTLVSATVLVCVGRPLISWWTGGTVEVGIALLGSCAAYALINAIWSPLHYVLLGKGLVRFQARCMLLMAPVNLLVSAVLIGPLGAAGPVVGSTASLALIVLLPYVVRARATVF